MNLLRKLIASYALLLSGFIFGADTATIQSSPAKIGTRDLVVEFSVDQAGKPTRIKLVSSEAQSLNNWAITLTHAGIIGPGKPGVVQTGDRQFRATASFPVAGDGQPLSGDISPPQFAFQAVPKYPFELRASGTTGGALLSLTIDAKARLKKVRVLRASHPEFGFAAQDAVDRWQFAQAASKDGKPIEVTMNLMVTFELVDAPLAPWDWCEAPAPAFPQFLITGEKMR